jgi:hypothetical protein
MSKQYVVNTPRVIHKVSGGEVVAIDLGTGAYYSLRGPAAVIWDAIDAGLTVDEVADHVRATHEVGEADVFADVSGLVDTLVGHDLISVGEPAANRPQDLGHDLPYEPPVVEAFTDMADVILLDPVHDVDAEAGWPHQPTANEATPGG